MTIKQTEPVLGDIYSLEVLLRSYEIAWLGHVMPLAELQLGVWSQGSTPCF